MFYAASKNQDQIFEKVNLFVALAPVTRLNGASKSLKLASSQLPMIKDALFTMSIHEIFDNHDRKKWTGFMNSITGRILNGFKNIISKAVSSGEYTDPQRELAASCRFPNEASTKELFHYGQIIDDKRLQEYDYGKAANQKKYGSDLPPIIDLKKITKLPVAMFVGKQDHLADPKDT